MGRPPVDVMFFPSSTSNRLLPRLVTAVVIKLVALGALWWWWVHDHRVEVDSATAATQMLGESQGQSQGQGQSSASSHRTTTPSDSPLEPSR